MHTKIDMNTVPCTAKVTVKVKGCRQMYTQTALKQYAPNHLIQDINIISPRKLVIVEFNTFAYCLVILKIQFSQYKTSQGINNGRNFQALCSQHF